MDDEYWFRRIVTSGDTPCGGQHLMRKFTKNYQNHKFTPCTIPFVQLFCAYICANLLAIFQYLHIARLLKLISIACLLNTDYKK